MRLSWLSCPAPPSRDSLVVLHEEWLWPTCSAQPQDMTVVTLSPLSLSNPPREWRGDPGGNQPLIIADRGRAGRLGKEVGQRALGGAGRGGRSAAVERLRGLLLL